MQCLDAVMGSRGPQRERERGAWWHGIRATRRPWSNAGKGIGPQASPTQL